MLLLLKIFAMDGTMFVSIFNLRVLTCPYISLINVQEPRGNPVSSIIFTTAKNWRKVARFAKGEWTAKCLLQLSEFLHFVKTVLNEVSNRLMFYTFKKK